MEFSIRKEQLLSVREASRYLGQQMERLARGDVDKIVIMNRSRMAAVMITPEEYGRLVNQARLGAQSRQGRKAA